MKKQDCHTGNPLVFEAGDVKVYAGGTNRNGGWHVMDPAPDLAMGPIGVIVSPKTRDVLPVGWGCTDTAKGASTTVLEIDWPDYNVPKNLGKEFWLALVEDIKERGITSISCQCMGGHGRTGVQVAVLAGLLIPEDQHEWTTAAELITWVRSRYCEHAVESKSQEKYIADMLDIPLGESVITLSSGGGWLSQPSAFVDFDEYSEFTPDEFMQQQKKSERKQKKGKKKQGVSWKRAIPTPLVSGWSLVMCPSCGTHEWRRATAKYMEEDCVTCGGEVFPIDYDVIAEQSMRCQITDMSCHPMDMYDDISSKFAEAEKQGLQTKFDTNNDPVIKWNTKWYPMSFFMRTEDGNLVAASELWKERVKNAKKEKSKKPKPLSRKQRKSKTLDDYVVQSLDINELGFLDEE